jgi:hypothetical protein
VLMEPLVDELEEISHYIPSPPCPIFGVQAFADDALAGGKVLRRLKYCRMTIPDAYIAHVDIVSWIEAFAAACDDFTSKPAVTGPLRRLSVPAALEESRLRPYSTLWTAVRLLLRACKSRQVEVDYHEGNEARGESFLPADMMKYARRLRLEKEQGETV